MTGVTIRPCQQDECAVDMDLWKDAGSIPSITDNVKVLRRLIQNTSTVLLVAEYQNTLVGAVVAGWDGWRGNIYRLVVLPTYRRRGIGRLLVREAEYFFSAKGVQRIGGLVARGEPLAVSFWDALADAGYNRDSTFVRYAKNLE